jgi:hypothetical protein
MENKKDALELLDLMIEEATHGSRDNSIAVGLVKVLERVKKRLEGVRTSS